LFIVLAVISINYANGLRGFVTDISTFAAKQYFSLKKSASNKLSEHFNQQDEIKSLREQNAKLEERALVLNAVSSKLNSMLIAANISAYAPKTQLVRALSYSEFGDYNRVWLDFPNFNASKIYGLIYQGYSAGIVTQSGGKALALLQYDPKSAFSVYMGNNKIKGIAFGAEDKIEVKYIPLWTEPKVGDEVITSGLDNIFFEGVKVGKISWVYKDESYFTAVVKPYANADIPGFFHVILSN
jgi:rod shape-determining protein MreC